MVTIVMRTAPVCLTTFPGLPSWTDAHVKAPENLREILQQFATDAKTLQERCPILRMQYGYSIKKKTLKNLNREHSIVSADQLLPEHIYATLIVKQMAENVTGTNGPNTIQKRIALKMVFLLLGKFIGLFFVLLSVRRTMHALDPGGPARHFPSKWPPKVRSTLTDTAIEEEQSSVLVDSKDGSVVRISGVWVKQKVEVFTGDVFTVEHSGHWSWRRWWFGGPVYRRALPMGRASIDMYGGQYHGSGYIVHMTVVPNARNPHPNHTTWTEPQYMFQFHEQLWAQFLPDVSSTVAPACVALKSSDNIPIEALWSHFLKYTGHDLKAAILLGKTENYINVSNKLHITVQNAVNQFHTQNRKQSSKYLPSGVAPEEVFHHPENFGLRHAGIPVDLNVVCELRNMLPKSREDCFRWVLPDFDLRAVAAYESLGSPELTISTGWTVYRRILAIL
ncbi:hypothetical protein B0H14DRAFT_2577395 [Mycena olivaceomarginata]|nr:hypothetical protein B0H14DRAFT_2577395 [Mycena olivaceomarginata]